MWKLDSNSQLDLSFKNMRPHEVLYEFDGPSIFTFEVQAQLFIAYLCDEDFEKKQLRYLVADTTVNEISSLKIGGISVYGVLDKAFVWAVDRSFDGETLAVVCIAGGLASVPMLNKPEKTALLYAELETDVETLRSVEKKIYSTQIAATHALHELHELHGLHRLQELHKFKEINSSSGFVLWGYKDSVSSLRNDLMVTFDQGSRVSGFVKEAIADNLKLFGDGDMGENYFHKEKYKLHVSEMALAQTSKARSRA